MTLEDQLEQCIQKNEMLMISNRKLLAKMGKKVNDDSRAVVYIVLFVVFLVLSKLGV